jgi:hypothetical protein
MNGWRNHLFGRSELNFWGWIAAGLVVFAVVLVCGIAAARRLFPGGRLDAHLVVLLGILAVLTGHFALALQEYHARWIEARARERERPPA